MFDLTGKTALVTGASSGLGLAIARTLHQAGATVGLSGTRREALETLAGELKERAHILPCNLSDRAETDKLIPAAEGAMGGVDILVNNAGITRDMLFMRMKDEDWDAVLAVNLTAAFRLSRAVLRGMMRKRHGRIINITSVAGAVGNPGQANYSAAKAGLTGMTKSLANEVASRGVTVNCVAPGVIESPMTQVLNEAQRERLLKLIPMERFGSADEIGAAVLYLASDEAAFITGQTLHINGGMAMIS
ncbi:3-oxoacyl-[acyl-carrier-protein] reductase [Methylocystis bryophila]|uniref:3-oxoacyl-[acyl-carrier-protein] reductase n=1 Tax=Methylocystis bryophila TaxID=655015 RepID=A0A1W6MRI7_9HYPH|nr:3-oxoacyl-[acyl-carrier-protein] reductase [Methylocystis bryophila]ARN80220.1 3-oxoacyl-[acyl-carrier-protein] reductase [Methylocystis bryophila]BDV40176.1 beta-ketoacyl-ACP reductase [Methylocystis bryophila]